MEQYPDTIILTVKGAPTQGTGGIYSAGTTTTYTLKGRAEPNGAGRTISGPDGNQVSYTFTFYLPAMTTVIPYGSAYLLNGSIAGTVKGASNGQFNSRLWL